jgi:hypothetical protein
MLNTYLTSFGDGETELNYSYLWGQKVRKTLTDNNIKWREAKPSEESLLTTILVSEQDITKACELLNIKQVFIDFQL